MTLSMLSWFASTLTADLHVQSGLSRGTTSAEGVRLGLEAHTAEGLS